MKVIKPSEIQRHLLLYSKEWYQKAGHSYSFCISDLKEIVGKCVAMDPKHIEDGGVYYWVLNTLIEIGGPDEVEFYSKNLFNTMNGCGSYWEGKALTPQRAINQILGRLSVLTVRSESVNIDLGEPDSKILPLSKISLDRFGKKS